MPLQEFTAPGRTVNPLRTSDSTPMPRHRHFRRKFMRQITKRTISIVLMVVFATIVFAQPDQPQTQPQDQIRPSRDMEKELAIQRQLEKIAPKSVATFKAATEALDKDDYEQAAKLY